MSPFFHGGVRPVKKYARPWSMNPRLNPELNKGDARISILGLPSFETGINLPVFNGVYPKPGKDELSGVDEAVIVSSNRDSDLNDENANPEAGNVVGEKQQLEPLVEEPEAEAFVDETTKEMTLPQPSESAPAPVPAPDENILSASEPLPTGSPVVNDLVDHDNPEEPAPELGTMEAAQPQIGEADSIEAGSEDRADDVEAHSDHQADPAAAPTDHGLEQAQDIPAEPLPPISEEPAESEEQVQNLESSEVAADGEIEAVSGPAGLGPLEVIKEEPVVGEEAVTASNEHSAVDGTHLQVDKDITNEASNAGGLETVQEAPELIENAAAREMETPVDSADTHNGDATFDEQAAGDTTPVGEKRDTLGVPGGEYAAIDRKDSMFETPFETPMEKQSTMNEGATPFETSFETPMERPFWAPGGAAAAAAAPSQQHVPEETPLDGDDDDDDDEPAEGPFIPRHSPDVGPVTETAPSLGEPDHDAKGFHGMPEGRHYHQITPSVGTASAAESATDVEPLLSDEQLDVDDEFRPGVRMQSV
ncbi:hypothetical protein N0V82_004657 [Gnomoniopsis sp. IMI 355080]|nr:hypothetical protein N0V82_004657 [Gnomoniopsis sp. IMI 355080]